MKCTYCNSENTYFSKKKNLYICEECGKENKAVNEFIQKHLFISYGHDPKYKEHIDIAYRLRDDLINRNHKVWFDADRLKPGYDWELFIENGLDELAKDRVNSFLILLLTPYSVRRPNGYCLNEVAKALDMGISIIPLMIDQCVVPLSIYRIQWLDMKPCIPVSQKEGVYNSCFKRLTEAIEEGKIDFEGTQRRLFSVLDPIEFEADIFRMRRDFTGREWIIEEFDKWVNNPLGKKVFWLLGEPGVGKSAIAAWLRDNRSEIAAFHFCKIESKEKRDPVKLVLSIAYQLSTQLPEYESRLAHLNLETIIKEYHDDAYTLFDKLIVQPFANKYPDPSRIFIILVDALDESRDNSKDNRIIDFLKLNVEETPKWIRFFITSRPEPEIRSSLRTLNPFTLDTKCENNLNDIRRYLINQISNISDEQIISIINKSEGVFLYIVNICKELKLNGLSLIRNNEFPTGLGGFYKKYFDRYFENDIDYYKKEIRELLYPIFACYEPPSIGFLVKYLEYDNAVDLFDRLDRMGSLIVKSGVRETDTVKPYHRSIKDWIVDNDKSGAYSIDLNYGHKRLAKYGWDLYEKGELFDNLYFLHFLSEHLLHIESWDRLSILLSDIGYLDIIYKEGKKHELMRCLRIISEHCILSEIFSASIIKLKDKGIDKTKLFNFTNQITQLLRDMGLATDALPFALQAVEYLKVNMPNNHPKIADASRDLAEVYRRNKSYDHALAYYNDALKIYSINYGENSSQVATIYHDYAEYYRDIGKYTEAIKYNKLALSIRKKMNPPDIHALADCINDTGVLIWESNIEQEDVLHYYEESLELFQSLYGEYHYDISAVLGNIGNYHYHYSYFVQNKDEALEMLKLSLSYLEKSYKMMSMFRVKHHIDVCRIRRSLIQSYDIMGIYTAAAELQKEELRSVEIISQNGSIEIFHARQYLANLQKKCGNDKEYLNLHLDNYRDVKQYFKDGYSGMDKKDLEEYYVFIRNLAYDCYENNMLNEAVEIYYYLIENNYEKSGTYCHLARIYLLTNREKEAKDAIYKASQFIDDDKPYIKARVLFFKILFGFIDNKNMTEMVIQLSEFLENKEHRLKWTIQPVMEIIKPKLQERDYNVLQNFADIINRC
ncbi:MAG: toll/interleukin-1 receptor domain-containing protein [Ignavibacteriaceae bacterium]|nr:toll/interleukin-1 receptor domain-containing protein [Ignavibacteriaceae bacterium]